MSQEQYANNAATTLNGAINNLVTSLVVTSAAGFPTSGEFRIKINSELLLVTAVSGTTFTVSRGAESSAATSHSNGDAVTLVMTKQSLLNLIKDGNYADTYSNRPTAGRAGAMFRPTDHKGLNYRDTGSAWQLIPAPPVFTAPNISLFPTWDNQQDATFAAVQDFIRFEDPGGTASGEDWRLRYTSITGSNTAEIVSAFRLHFSARSTAQVYAHFYRKSSTSKFAALGLLLRLDDVAPRIFGFRLDTVNSYAGSYFEATGWPGATNGGLVFMKTKWTTPDGYELFFSINGEYWIKVATLNDTNVSGPDQFGITINNFTPAAVNPSMAVDIYQLTKAET